MMSDQLPSLFSPSRHAETEVAMLRKLQLRAQSHAQSGGVSRDWFQWVMTIFLWIYPLAMENPCKWRLIWKIHV